MGNQKSGLLVVVLTMMVETVLQNGLNIQGNSQTKL